MTIKASGSLPLAEIQAEFGGGNPIGIDEYYRANGLVPSTQTKIPVKNNPISIGDFYGASKAVPGPSPVLLTNTGENEDYAYWTSPVTGTIYVTLVGAGGGGGENVGGWGGYADSSGGAGGGGGGQIIHRHAVSVTKGQAYAYKVKPVTYGQVENTYYDPSYDEYITELQNVVYGPVTEMFSMTAAYGNQGYQSGGGTNRYTGMPGGASAGNSGAGGRGGDSRINTQGLPGSAGGSSSWANGGEGGRAGTGWSDQSSPGAQGYGYGAGGGGAVGYKGSDNPDTAGGGGGGGGGFLPAGYAANFRAPAESHWYWGAQGCIYIEFESSYPV